LSAVHDTGKVPVRLQFSMFLRRPGVEVTRAELRARAASGGGRALLTRPPPAACSRAQRRPGSRLRRPCRPYVVNRVVRLLQLSGMPPVKVPLLTHLRAQSHSACGRRAATRNKQQAASSKQQAARRGSAAQAGGPPGPLTSSPRAGAPPIRRAGCRSAGCTRSRCGGKGGRQARQRWSPLAAASAPPGWFRRGASAGGSHGHPARHDAPRGGQGAGEVVRAHVPGSRGGRGHELGGLQWAGLSGPSLGRQCSRWRGSFPGGQGKDGLHSVQRRQRRQLVRQVAAQLLLVQEPAAAAAAAAAAASGPLS
jgi:hypothetical protein